MNGGATNGNGKHKRKSRFNEEMSGSVLNKVLWEILPELSNRHLDSPGLKGEIWAGDVDLDVLGQIVSSRMRMLWS